MRSITWNVLAADILNARVDVPDSPAQQRFRAALDRREHR
jgi:phosphodiesterase/alkaline phosphatase D-like protein